MNRLLVGILIGLVVGVPLGAVVSLMIKAQPGGVQSGNATQKAKLSGGQNPQPPLNKDPGKPTPKQQQPKTTLRPAIPAKWVPAIGESCIYEVPESFVMRDPDGKPMYLVARDLLSFEQMLKYIEASDGVGLTDLLETRSIFSSPTKTLNVKILSINSDVGYAEVRMQSGNQLERTPSKRLAEGMLNKEVVIPLSHIQKKQSE